MTGVLVEAGLCALTAAVVAAQVHAARQDRDVPRYAPRHRR